MISFFAGVALANATAQTEADLGPMALASRALRECVATQAVGMEPAGETVQFTVDAAFMACVDEGAAYELAVAYVQDSDTVTSDESKRRIRQAGVERVIQLLRSQVTVSLMKLRAARR